MSKKNKKYLITWRDAFHPGSCGWMQKEDVEEFIADMDYICESIGYVIHEDKDMVTVASMRSTEDNSYSHLQRIPTGCIIKKKLLK